MKNKEIGIGLIGFGTVGSGVVKILRDSGGLLNEKIGGRLVLKKIADLDIKSRRCVKVDRKLLTTDAGEVLDDPGIDIVIELTGSQNAGTKLILGALAKRKFVVTANKAALAGSWREIFAAAKKNRAGVCFEASVGAGIPVIQSIREGMAANRITRIFGIVNGTTNYILTQMGRSGASFGEALSEAKVKGFAEPDPTLDINGSDSAHKLSVLSSLAFGRVVRPADISVEGIDGIDPADIKYGSEFGYTLKLLAIAKASGSAIEARVHPTFLPNSHLLSSVDNEYNAIYIVGDLTGPVVLYGRGAGQMSAASAVIGDVIYIGQNIIAGTADKIFVPWQEKRNGFKIRDIKDIKSKCYMRFSVVDSPGVLAKISNILGRNNISIAKNIQKEEKKKNTVPVVMTTQNACETDIKRALGLISRLDVVRKKTVMIRIEE